MNRQKQSKKTSLWTWETVEKEEGTKWGVITDRHNLLTVPQNYNETLVMGH